MISYAYEADKKGAKLICFPECFLQGYEISNQTNTIGINLFEIEFKDILRQLRSIQATLVLGLIELEDENTFNTAVVIKEGKLIGKYRKVNLLGNERDVFSPGLSYPIFNIDEVKFGINICYDLNFSNSAKAISKQGANLLVCPSNNMLTDQIAEQWKDKHNISRSKRSIETGLWLISSDVTGRYKGKVGYGPTAVIDPKGRIIKQLPLMKSGLLIYEIDFSKRPSHV